MEQLGDDGSFGEALEHPEVLGHPLHPGRRHVAVRHHRQVRLDRLGRLLGAGGCPQPLGELHAPRALGPPAGEPHEGPAIELVEDRCLPGREHARPDRPHVRPREQVEHLQALRVARDGRQVRDRLGIVDVPALRDVRHRQVVGDQELDHRPVSRLEAHSLDQLTDQRNALGDVAVPLRLPDVVQEHAEHQELGLVHLVEHLRGALRFRRLAGRQRLEVLDAEQRVLVGRELVVDVVLDEARQRAELRQVPPEQADLVHLRERLGDAAPPAADVEEEVAHLP